MSVNKRIRRSPEEAREHILNAAESRLADLGLDGLTVSGVAGAAGISHANVIHHFGSTDGMRSALFGRMTKQLLDDVSNALRAEVPTEEIMKRLFSTLTRPGHGNLLAWRMLGNVELPDDGGAQDRFASILATVAEERPDEARNLIMLIAAAAMGISICREPLQQMIGYSDEELEAFPAWLANLVHPGDGQD